MSNSRDEEVKLDVRAQEIQELTSSTHEHDELRKENNSCSRRSSHKFTPTALEINKLEKQLGGVPKRLEEISKELMR